VNNLDVTIPHVLKTIDLTDKTETIEYEL